MAKAAKPLLHLVFGGEVEDPSGTDFVDPAKLDVVGLFPNYAAALKAWKGASMSQIDNASYKYVIVHLHRLMDPDHDAKPPAKTRAPAKSKSAAKRKK
jgi:hypothetical protein